jgi:hypothetical protein
MTFNVRSLRLTQQAAEEQQQQQQQQQQVQKGFTNRRACLAANQNQTYFAQLYCIVVD